MPFLSRNFFSPERSCFGKGVVHAHVHEVTRAGYAFYYRPHTLHCVPQEPPSLEDLSPCGVVATTNVRALIITFVNVCHWGLLLTRALLMLSFCLPICWFADIYMSGGDSLVRNLDGPEALSCCVGIIADS